MKLEDIVALAKAGYTADQIDKFVTYQKQPVPPVQQVQTVPSVQQVQTVPSVDMLTRGGSREIKSFDDVYNMMRELSNQIIASNVVASRQPEPEYNPSDELAKIINPYDDKEEKNGK